VHDEGIALEVLRIVAAGGVVHGDVGARELPDPPRYLHATYVVLESVMGAGLRDEDAVPGPESLKPGGALGEEGDVPLKREKRIEKVVQ
jgi:hypothetical protein